MAVNLLTVEHKVVAVCEVNVVAKQYVVGGRRWHRSIEFT